MASYGKRDTVKTTRNYPTMQKANVDFAGMDSAMVETLKGLRGAAGSGSPATPATPTTPAAHPLQDILTSIARFFTGKPK